MNRTVVLGTAGAIVLAAGVYVLGAVTGFFGKGRPETNVTLALVGGVCHADVSNDLGGSHNDKITWKITNTNCTDAQYVSFTEYKEYLTSGYGSPDADVVDVARPVTTSAIAVGTPGSYDVHIKMKHYKPFGEKRYKYKVCVGTDANTTGSCTDPDLDVWPF
jgi:hypothetical protein